MKKGIALFSCFLLLILTVSCKGKETVQPESVYYSFTDDLGYPVRLSQKPGKAVSLLGSYGELWLLAGGSLSGITEDAVSQRELVLEEDVQIIGTVQKPNLELILQLSPGFVLLSADLSAHTALADTLENAGIPHAFFKTDTVAQYLHMLKVCTEITGAQEAYEQYGTAVEKEVSEVLEKVPKDMEPAKVLLIRSTSTQAKALKSDHMTGRMLADLGTVNIAEDQESLLEELSMEVILREDPDFIFIVPTGDTEAAVQTMESGIMANPAWGSLAAIKNNRYYVLPKELFQYKPNARWGESYAYLYQILYS